jgi:uncharacterized protein (TIGR02996 family)
MDEETAFLRSIVANPDDEALRLAFTDWLEDRDRWPNGAASTTECGHDYPQRHRLCDVRLRGEPFRVTRCMTCNGKLQLFRVADSVWGSEPGVPLWLEGEALRRWIEDERAAESAAEGDEDLRDHPTDWERYRLLGQAEPGAAADPARPSGSEPFHGHQGGPGG